MNYNEQIDNNYKLTEMIDANEFNNSTEIFFISPFRKEKNLYFITSAILSSSSSSLSSLT
ncbi:hypothetical protein DERP_001759 [Dermatophagoides pteronyssinus]|uniref:Uncharacterized protein n=1 Tax=Dermatophagoides pteronyssinus TaxID=6956 RepID=A0ABQ8JBF1_DERPT|nr:hypothetical protein DERP_001759 [Dermatophagoides pteronyssinus]